jgi:hypothetical protein
MSYEERTVRRFAWADTRCADGTWHRWEWLLYRQRTVPGRCRAPRRVVFVASVSPSSPPPAR